MREGGGGGGAEEEEKGVAGKEEVAHKAAEALLVRTFGSSAMLKVEVDVN